MELKRTFWCLSEPRLHSVPSQSDQTFYSLTIFTATAFCNRHHSTGWLIANDRPWLSMWLSLLVSCMMKSFLCMCQWLLMSNVVLSCWLCCFPDIQLSWISNHTWSVQFFKKCLCIYSNLWPGFAKWTLISNRNQWDLAWFQTFLVSDPRDFWGL